MNNTYNTRKILVIIRNPMGISVPLIRAPLTSKQEKNIENIGGVFVVMQYNEKIGKWQVSGTIGGVM